MTGFDCERAIFKFLDEQYGGSIDSGSPGSFDPESEDVTSWIWWALQEIREPPTRKGNLRFGQVRLLVQCWNKDRDGIKPAKQTAETIAELLRHRVITVTDLDDVDTPTIGYLQLWEPVISDMSNTTPGYQCAVVTVLGVMEETE